MGSETAKQWKRLRAEEALELVRVPVPAESNNSAVSHRYMSTQPAWNAGSLFAGTGRDIKAAQSGVFGGTVYAQAPLAASRSLEEVSESATGASKPTAKFGIHVSISSALLTSNSY